MTHEKTAIAVIAIFVIGILGGILLVYSNIQRKKGRRKY
jgi:hypothetical protein